jgi:hypothetical protein
MAITFASILLIYLMGPIDRKETVIESPVIIEETEIISDAPTNKDKLIDTVTPKTGIPEKLISEIPATEKVEEPAIKKSGFTNYFADIGVYNDISRYNSPINVGSNIINGYNFNREDGKPAFIYNKNVGILSIIIDSSLTYTLIK